MDSEEKTVRHQPCCDLLSITKDVYLDEDGLKQRNEILDEIQNLADISSHMILDPKVPPGNVLKSYVKACAFGGQALGIVSKEGDLDVLVIVCKRITRQDFFSSFYQLLSEHVLVTQHRAVEAAYVPLIHVVFKGVPVDVCVCCLPCESIPPEEDLVGNDILRDLNKECVRSLNGLRHAVALKSLVPCEDSFKETLKAIKIWAEARCIYKNVMGYLSGIALAVMVAKICQMFPSEEPPVLLQHFFTVYSKWKWPNPVRLKEEEPDLYNLAQWNPRVKANSDLMPVISPSYPEKNCAFGVTKSTKIVIEKEISLGLKIVSSILDNEDAQNSWRSLFQPLRFFRLYKHFIMLKVSASSEQDLLSWSGMVESKLRFFVELFEEQSVIKLVHLYTKSYRLPTDRQEHKVPIMMWFLGLQFHKTESVDLDLSRDTRIFQSYLLEEGVTRNLFRPGMKLTAQYLKRKQLEDFVPHEELQK